MNKKVLRPIITGLLILGLFFSTTQARADQISVTGSCTLDTPSLQPTVIPAGSYHVYIESYTDYLSMTDIAYCTATNGTHTVFGFSTTTYTDTWESQATFTTTATVTFNFSIIGSAPLSHMNFQIVFTTLEVTTLTKTSIIAEAPLELGIIGI